MGESCVSGKKELQAALSSPIEEQESGVGKEGPGQRENLRLRPSVLREDGKEPLGLPP